VRRGLGLLEHFSFRLRLPLRNQPLRVRAGFCAPGGNPRPVLSRILSSVHSKFALGLVVAFGAGCGAPSGGGETTDGDGGTPVDRPATSTGGDPGVSAAAGAPGAASQRGEATGSTPNRASGGTASGGGPSNCRALGADCFDAPTSCCPGSQCVRDDEQPDVGVCTLECVSDADCPDGCCIDFGLTRVCAPYGPLCGLACVPAGQSCLANPCCEGALCIHTTQEGSHCAAFCASDEDCSTSCCGAVQGGPETVCLAASFCS